MENDNPYESKAVQDALDLIKSLRCGKILRQEFKMEFEKLMENNLKVVDSFEDVIITPKEKDEGEESYIFTIKNKKVLITKEGETNHNSILVKWLRAALKKITG